MFDIFLGKGSKKVSHELPDKQFTVDIKSLPKLSQKELCTLATEQQKYLKQVVKRFEKLRQDHLRSSEKVDELTEKNEIINQEIFRMNNEHEELSVKFNNLQSALEMTLNQNQRLTKESNGGGGGQLGSPNGLATSKISSFVNEEIKYTQIHFHSRVEFGVDIERCLQQLFEFYHGRMALFDKIEAQNRKLKEKLEEIQDFHSGKVSQPDNSQTEELTKRLEKKQAEVHILNERLTDTTSKLQHQLFVVKTLREESTELGQELARAKHELGELKKLNYLGLEIINVQLAEANTAKEKQITSLLSQLAEVDSSKQKAFSLMQSEINKLATQKEEAIRQLQNKLKDTNAKHDMDRASVVAETTSLKLDKAKALRDYEDMKSQREELERTVDELKQQKQTANDQANSTIAKLDGSIVQLKAEVSQHQKQNGQIRKELEEFKELIKDKQESQADNSVYLLEINQLKTKLDESKSAQATIEIQMRSQQVQCKNHVAELQNRVELIEQLNKQLSEQKQKRLTVESMATRTVDEAEEKLLHEQSSRHQTQARLASTTKTLEQTLIELQLKSSELESVSDELGKVRSRLLGNDSTVDMRLPTIDKLLGMYLDKIEEQHSQELEQLNNELALKQEQLENSRLKISELAKNSEEAERYYRTSKLTIESLEKKELELLNLVKQKNQLLQTSNKDLSILIEQKSQLEEFNSDTRGKVTKRVEELDKLCNEQARELEEREQRLRKAENEQNQDRIKIESLKKTIGKLEQKQKENKQSMEKIYEEMLLKTEKTLQLETKLKDYKKEILRQKAELAQQHENHEKKIGEMQAQLEAAQKNCETVQQKQHVEFSEKEFELQNKITILTDQVNSAEAEKDQLKEQIERLQEDNRENEQRVKALFQKREQALKEIQRLEKRLENNLKEPMKSPNGLTTQNSVIHQSSSGQDRARKITEKALRGFEILSRLLEVLYKDFITTFIDNMTEERIKRLEKGLNQLKKKSSQMQDVLEGYL